MPDEHGDSTSFKQKRSQHGRKLNLEVEELRWPTGPFQSAGTVPFFALKVLLWGDVCPEQTRMVCHLNSEPREEHKQGCGLQEMVRTQTQSRNIRKNGLRLPSVSHADGKPGPAFQWVQKSPQMHCISRYTGFSGGKLKVLFKWCYTREIWHN